MAYQQLIFVWVDKFFESASQRAQLAGKDMTDSLKRFVVQANDKDGYGDKLMKEFGNIQMWTTMKTSMARRQCIARG